MKKIRSLREVTEAKRVKKNNRRIRKKNRGKKGDKPTGKLLEVLLAKVGKGKVVEKKRKKNKSKYASYKEYLSSPEWKAKRSKVLRRANYKCEICKVNKAWQVHHNTYKRKYKERLGDLIAVCEDCHKGEHNLLTEEEIEIGIMKMLKNEGYF